MTITNATPRYSPTRGTGHENAHKSRGAGLAIAGGVERSSWLKLATVVNGSGGNMAEMLEAAGADFEVTSEPYVTPDPNGGAPMITGRNYTYRTYHVDSGGTEVRMHRGYNGYGRVGFNRATTPRTRVLGNSVGSDYPVINNRRTIELVEALAGESGLRVTAAGAYRDDQKFFALVELPDHVVDPGEGGLNDRHSRHIAISTDHTGGGAMKLTNTTRRLYCLNELAGMWRDERRVVTIQHRGDVELGIAEAKQKLGLLLTADDEFELIAQQLLNEGMTGFALIHKVADVIWKGGTEANPSELARERRKERLTKLDELYEVEVARCNGRNRYAAYQALTGYHQHHASVRMDRDLRAVDSGTFMRESVRIRRLLLEPELLDA